MDFALTDEQLALQETARRFAKSEIWAREREKNAADGAKARFEFKQLRDEREKAEKAEKLARELEDAQVSRVGEGIAVTFDSGILLPYDPSELTSEARSNLRKLAESDQLSEPAVAAALLSPAATEPDLVLLLGTSDRLPNSLVWELAYAEMVYVPVPWADLQEAHLAEAIEAYRRRHRRFGGLD